MLKHRTTLMILLALLLLAMLPAAPSLPVARAENAQQVKTVVVQLQRGTTLSSLQQMAADRAGVDLKTLQAENQPDEQGRLLVRIPEGETPEEFADKLEASLGTAILFAEPNGIAYGAGAPTTDPISAKQWHLPTVHAPESWAVQTGTFRGLAILDTGYDCTHQDLPPLAGYADFVQGLPCGDQHGHGSHVSGTACAYANNGVGVAGTAGGCSLLYVGRVLNKQNWGYWTDIARGIDWAISQPDVRVISMSIWAHETTPNPSQVLAEAVARAQAAGIIVVACAGNDGKGDGFNYPAMLPGVISVAATKPGNARWEKSNYGPWVTVSAPGAGIWSTLPGNQYDDWYGTSMATPQVAEALTRYLSRYPCATAAEAVNALVVSRQPLAAGLGGLLDEATMLSIPGSTCVYTNWVYLPVTARG